MNDNVKREITDGIIRAAFHEYINQELNNMPSDNELSKMHPVPKRELKKAHRQIKAQKYGRPLGIVYAQRILVSILTVITLSFGVLATSPDVRSAISKTVVEWQEKYVRISFNETKEPETTEVLTKDAEALEIKYIPDKLNSISTVEEPGKREYMYMADDGEYALIGIYSSESSTVMADTEFSSYEMIQINGQDANLLYNDAEKSGALIFGNESYTVSITCVMERSEMIAIAEGIE